jgi:hypothetical protein
MKHKLAWFEAGWFPYSYAFCPSERAWKVATSKMSRGPSPYPESAGATSLLVRKDTGTPIAIVTVQDRTPRETIELLAHEAMHVWRDVRKQMGETKPSSELEAYAIQNILSELMKAYEHSRGPLFFKLPSPSKRRKRPSGRANA